MRWVRSTFAARKLFTTSGWSFKNFVLTMITAVENLPSGHRSRSSRKILPLASRTRRAPHGSGTHAASISFLRKRFKMSALAVGITWVSPPCSVSVRPCFCSHARAATSCVLPNCGVAIFLPLKSAPVLMSSSPRTTNTAPPLVAPPMIRKASPFDLV